jgi:hypothetical protein
MPRRASTRIILALASLALAACSAAPTAPTRSLKVPTAPAADCIGGWSSSTGFAC